MIDSSDWQVAAEQLEALIGELTKQVRVLRHTVEDLRDEVFGESPNRRQEPVDAEERPAVTPPLRLKSMPLDPCDPEFGRKINAAENAETATAPPEQPRAATLNEFVAQLTREPPADQISFDQWTEGRTADSGVVVTVDDELFDWFADHFEAEYEAPGGAYVLADDNGGLYVIWSSNSAIFLRQLTEAEAGEFDELMRMAAEKAALKRDQFRNPEALQKQQGCLW